MAAASLSLTALCRIKNEERFVRTAIESVLPIVDHVLVYDTGSTDRTLEEIAAIGNPKIEVVRKPSANPRQLTALRNEMLERATTEWTMIVDGDEIYPRRAVERIRRILPAVPSHVHRIVMNRRHPVQSFNFLSIIDGCARIYRRAKVRHGIAVTKDGDAVGHETPYLLEDPLTSWSTFSMRMPRDAWFFHCQYLRRSPHDEQLGRRMRGWRKPPFPVSPYLGPWPETMRTDGLATSLTPVLLWQCAQLNAQSVWQRTRRGLWNVPGLWRLRHWPPADLLVMGRDGSWVPANTLVRQSRVPVPSPIAARRQGQVRA